MTGLPTGTITFLFTDIEGSTRRWEEQPHVMACALARHDALLREHIAAQGGSVFKTVGDAFCAAFATAPDALAAALAVQRALAAEEWGESAPLRVRMALHTGTAEERDGDYFGPPLNRVARLLSAGHGGQTLLSLATQVLVRDLLPAGVALRDLGEHRLKDLSHPEQIFQLVSPDLPATFPPLRTLDARRTNLPVQATPLIGREGEVAALGALLGRAEVRLVTLTGPGGVGKTRLGLQGAADLLDHFAHGAWFVNLAPVTDPALVASAIASVLGVREAGGQPLEDSLRSYLRDKQVLLLLDNCEQVLAAAPLVGELLATAPGLRVVATSRAPLRLAGEREYPVPPLALPDLRRPLPPAQLSQYAAVRLFVARAVAVKPHFAITTATAPAVAEICQRLDGLPLAIELAAARSRVLVPEALLARLDRRLRVLTGGARDLPARQRTLRDTIDWSYDLLDAGERTLFARLAVFVGGCTLDAVEAVCNAAAGALGALPLDVLDGVESLVARSLLRQEEAVGGEARLVMLETLHEYARERLEASGEVEVLQRRHAEHFLALAEGAEPQLTGPEQWVWLARLEGEHDNLRAALGWALDAGESEMALRLGGALWRFWYARGRPSEGRRWLEAVLAGSTISSAALRAKALYGAGVLAETQGDHAAHALLGEALALRRELGDKPGVAAILNSLGIVARGRSDYATARALHEEALMLRRELGDEWGIATSLNNLGIVVQDQGDHAAARALYEESLALCRKLGDKGGVANALSNLGLLAGYQGDHAAARALYEESLDIKRELGDRQNIAYALGNLGGVAWRQGDHAAARMLHEESLVILRELRDQRGIAVALHGLGLVARDQGDYTTARTCFSEGLTLWRALEYRRGIAESLEGLAAMAVAQGQAARAVQLWGTAAVLREAVGAPLAPIDRADYERVVATARTLIGEAAWQSAWAAGRAMPLDQAIAEALAMRE